MVDRGLVGGCSQYLTTRAYALAPAALVSSFGYAGILWATLFGWLVFGRGTACEVAKVED